MTILNSIKPYLLRFSKKWSHIYVVYSIFQHILSHKKSIKLKFTITLIHVYIYDIQILRILHFLSGIAKRLVNFFYGFWWDGDTSAPLVLLPSMWPTFPTMSKSINLVIITSLIGKFAFFVSWNGWELKPSQYPLIIKSRTKAISPPTLHLTFNSSLSTNVYWLLGYWFL